MRYVGICLNTKERDVGNMIEIITEEEMDLAKKHGKQGSTLLGEKLGYNPTFMEYQNYFYEVYENGVSSWVFLKCDTTDEIDLITRLKGDKYHLIMELDIKDHELLNPDYIYNVIKIHNRQKILQSL